MIERIKMVCWAFLLLPLMTVALLLLWLAQRIIQQNRQIEDETTEEDFPEEIEV